jgi:hypothetical protein
VTTAGLTDVFRREYEATRSIDAAVAAVATTVAAQLNLPFSAPQPAAPVELRVTVVHEYPAPVKNVATRVLILAAQEFNIDVRSMLGRWAPRTRPHVDARWTAAAVLREAGMSLPACGRAVGLRDHTSVMYGLKQVEARPDLQAAVARVRAALEAAPPAIKGHARTTTTTREIEAA